MLTLQAQHPPTGNTYFTSTSTSPSPTPTYISSPLSTMMAEVQATTPTPTPSTPTSANSNGVRSRRQSRHMINPTNISSTSSSSSSIYAPFPKFQLGDGSASLLAPPLVSTGSRLRFGETWPQQDRLNEEVLDHVPESLLIPTLPEDRFVDAFGQAPRAVATIIALLHGSYELLNFCHASKKMGNLMSALFDNNDAVRDAFLSRIIRGYEPSATWLNKTIRIDLPDTELLLESESVSLAAYPTHALRVVTPPTSHSSGSSLENEDLDNTTSRFQTLTLAHSRFVAFLRHRTAPQALQLALQDEDDALPTTPDSDGPPELIFPSPLFYFKDIEQPIVPAYLPLPTSEPSGTTKSRRGSKSQSDAPKLSKSKSVGNLHTKAAEGNYGGEEGTRKKRLSLKPKKKSTVPPPPPSSMPPMPGTAMHSMPTAMSMPGLPTDQFGNLSAPIGVGMSHTFGGHTRSRSQTSMTAPPQTQSFSQTFNPYKGYTPPASGYFTPPPVPGQYTPPSSSYGRNTPPLTSFGGNGGSNPPSISNRRRNRQSMHMPEWSNASSGQLNRSSQFLSNSPGAMTPASTMPGTAMSGYYDPNSQPGGPGELHSLSQVFRLTRAPIFRVFVPCTQLNETILRTCMAQLFAADLVPQLRAGDLVCNLGYVPDMGTADEASIEGDCRGWMIFSGHDLHPLTIKMPIPVRDPTFVLNSPHYYSHVLLAGENPRFELAIPLVPQERSPPAHFSLVRVTDSVKTLVKNAKEAEAGEVPIPRKHKISRFIWLARVECARWGTEWLIEAEGTKEGRAYIEHALTDSRNGLEREWTLIREKTGRGRVYIKKL